MYSWKCNTNHTLSHLFKPIMNMLETIQATAGQSSVNVTVSPWVDSGLHVWSHMGLFYSSKSFHIFCYSHENYTKDKKELFNWLAALADSVVVVVLVLVGLHNSLTWWCWFPLVKLPMTHPIKPQIGAEEQTFKTRSNVMNAALRIWQKSNWLTSLKVWVMSHFWYRHNDMCISVSESNSRWGAK